MWRFRGGLRSPYSLPLTTAACGRVINSFGSSSSPSPSLSPSPSFFLAPFWDSYFRCLVLLAVWEKGSQDESVAKLPPSPGHGRFGRCEHPGPSRSHWAVWRGIRKKADYSETWWMGGVGPPSAEEVYGKQGTAVPKFKSPWTNDTACLRAAWVYEGQSQSICSVMIIVK